MSRIGKLPVSIKGVEVKLENGVVTMKSSKGQLSLAFPVDLLNFEVKDEQIILTRKDEDKFTRALHGTTRANLKNMVTGLTEGFVRKLVYKGVGYNWTVTGKTLNLSLGFSHPITEQIPEGLTCAIEKPEAVKGTAQDTFLVISGCNKQLVGQFAAKVRSYKKPEPYLGKGIRYSDEHIIRKQGKKLSS